MKSSHGSTNTRAVLEDIRREELIAATLRVVSESGFERATVRDIARAAGASIGSVNYYFKSKDELLLAAMAESDARFRTRVREAVAQADGHARALERVAELCFSDVDGEGVDWGVFVDFWQQASRGDEFRAIFEEANSEWVELLSTILAAGAEDGTLSFEDSAMDVALSFAALIDGLALHTRVTRHVDNATAERLAKNYIQGLRVQAPARRRRSA